MAQLPQAYLDLAEELSAYVVRLEEAQDKSAMLQALIAELFPAKDLRDSDLEVDKQVVAEVAAELAALPSASSLLEQFEHSNRVEAIEAKLTQTPEVVFEAEWVSHHLGTDSNRVAWFANDDMSKESVAELLDRLSHTTSLNDPRPDLYQVRVGYRGAMYDEANGQEGAVEEYKQMIVDERGISSEDMDYVRDSLISVHPVTYMVAMAESRLDAVAEALNEQMAGGTAAKFDEVRELIGELRVDLSVLKTIGEEKLTVLAQSAHELG